MRVFSSSYRRADEGDIVCKIWIDRHDVIPHDRLSCVLNRYSAADFRKMRCQIHGPLDPAIDNIGINCILSSSQMQPSEQQRSEI